MRKNALSCNAEESFKILYADPQMMDCLRNFLEDQIDSLRHVANRQTNKQTEKRRVKHNRLAEIIKYMSNCAI